MMGITKTDVEQMPADTILWDSGRGSVAGFGVRRQRKHPTFILKYVLRSRQRWHVIGRFGAPWTVEQARVEAKRLHGQIASGEDLATTSAAEAAYPTVSHLCDQYLVAATSGAVLTRFNRPKKVSTLAIDVGRIERHIKPLIGAMLVRDVDSRIVKKLIQDITLGKTATTAKTKLRGKAVVTGGAGTAARVADLLSGIMTWAIDEGYIDRNPVHKVRRFRGEPRDRFLSRAELAALGRRMRVAEDDDKRRFHPYALLIVRLLSLTGCRSSEITGLKWSEVDLEQKCLRLADSKSGKSLRAIGTAAIDIISAQPRHLGSPFVFPGAKGTSAYQGLTKEARRLFQSAGMTNVSCHTLRHTFASVASELGYSDGTIAGLLGHRGGSVTSRYVHRPDAALASAAEAVSQFTYEALGALGEQGGVELSADN